MFGLTFKTFIAALLLLVAATNVAAYCDAKGQPVPVDDRSAGHRSPRDLFRSLLVDRSCIKARAEDIGYPTLPIREEGN